MKQTWAAAVAIALLKMKVESIECALQEKESYERATAVTNALLKKKVESMECALQEKESNEKASAVTNAFLKKKVESMECALQQKESNEKILKQEVSLCATTSMEITDKLFFQCHLSY